MAQQVTYTGIKTAGFRLSVVSCSWNLVLTTAVRHGKRYQMFFDAGAGHEITGMRSVHVAAQTTNLSHHTR